MGSFLGHGIYTIAEASRLTGLRAGRIREWFLGRERDPRRQRPVFHGDYAPVGRDFAISFHDLVDVFVAGQLREHGVPLETVRRVYRKLQADWDQRHPFCHRELLTHGKAVLTRGLDERGREQITEVLTGQRVFPEVIRPFLQAIDYDPGALARRWRIAAGVVVDPAIHFGKPVADGTRVATFILAGAYRANRRDADRVADWYNVAPDQVLATVAYESRAAV